MYAVACRKSCPQNQPSTYKTISIKMPPKPAPTHFLCIPLAGAQLVRNLAAFRADVSNINSFAIPEDALRPPGTIHLTLGVMSLPQQAQLDKAVELLKGLQLRDILADVRASLAKQQSQLGGVTVADAARPSIALRGLRAMQSPTKTSVLYAPPVDVDGSGTLYKFCDAVRRVFMEAGLMVDDGRPLLLHATVVNTIYAKGSNGRSRRKEKLMLDASGIMARYEDFTWVDLLEVGRFAVCKMGAKKLEDGDAVYEEVASVEI